MLLGNIFPQVNKLPTLNIFNGVSDKFACLSHKQIILKTPSDRRPNTNVASTPQVSSATKILLCKFTSSATWFLYTRIDIFEKTPLSLLSICLFSCFSAPRVGQISLKLYIGILHENNSRRSKFGENRTEMWDTLHKDLSSFHSLRRNYLRKIPLFKEVVLVLLC